MAWSLPFTTRRSIVKDSFQRLYVTIPIEEIGDDFSEKVLRLSKANLLNISVTAMRDVNANNIDSVLVKIQELYDLEQQIDAAHTIHLEKGGLERQLFLSLQVPHSASFLISKLAPLELRFDLVVLHMDEQREKCVADVEKIRSILQESGKNTALGIGSIADAVQLDWLLCRVADTLKFVHLGSLQVPDFRLHCLELAHSRGLNTLMEIDAAALADAVPSWDLLDDLAAHHLVPADTCLVKCMLQLGLVVGLPFSVANDEDHLHAHFARLCHPFVHRKEFASAVRVVALKIGPHETDRLVQASHECALSAEPAWEAYATERNPPRTLTYNRSGNPSEGAGGS
ncbi:hypothetical protein B484DRAFT_428410 [Ochromonadaceae sp. CCMP2298]|nr:hypothetical protein B484DRAFT_428410 [Ochromonadaceae sp. CCMP2298]|mmetsp:Transcript_23151/g.51428  ORF Transcript_23151/g.51428 Transcript_23151/m.51428 type:complete len:342 (+) Transcript_23151:99-1124(+)